MKTKSIAKIFLEADRLPTIAEKVTHLRNWGNAQVKEIIRHVFDPNIVYDVTITPTKKAEDDWTIKMGDLSEYRPLPDDGTNEGAFYYEIRKRLIYLIAGGPGVALGQDNRDALFHSILESINELDSELLLSVKDKKWPYETLTPTVLNEAYPDIIPINIAAKVVVKKAAETRKPTAKAPAKKATKKAAKKTTKTAKKKA